MIDLSLVRLRIHLKTSKIKKLMTTGQKIKIHRAVHVSMNDNRRKYVTDLPTIKTIVIF